MQANTKKGGGEAISVGIKLFCFPVIGAMDAVLDAVAKYRRDGAAR